MSSIRLLFDNNRVFSSVFFFLFVNAHLIYSTAASGRRTQPQCASRAARELSVVINLMDCISIARGTLWRARAHTSRRMQCAPENPLSCDRMVLCALDGAPLGAYTADRTPYRNHQQVLAMWTLCIYTRCAHKRRTKRVEFWFVFFSLLLRLHGHEHRIPCSWRADLPATSLLRASLVCDAPYKHILYLLVNLYEWTVNRILCVYLINIQRLRCLIKPVTRTCVMRVVSSSSSSSSLSPRAQRAMNWSNYLKNTRCSDIAVWMHHFKCGRETRAHLNAPLYHHIECARYLARAFYRQRKSARAQC